MFADGSLMHGSKISKTRSNIRAKIGNQKIMHNHNFMKHEF